jgi:hypothetical protein
VALALVPVFVAVISAFGTKAPVESLMTPRRSPLIAWPKAQVDKSSRIPIKEIRTSVLLFIALSASLID